MIYVGGMDQDPDSSHFPTFLCHSSSVASLCTWN